MNIDKNIIDAINDKNSTRKWKPLFMAEDSNIIFRIIGIIFNFFSATIFNTILLSIILLLIFKKFILALVLFSILAPILIARFLIKWFAKNYKNIRISPGPDNITFVKLENDKNEIK